MPNFDINILVNGNRCKQYHHEGKIYVEAKEGSEYEIEIKNNTYNRVLVVGSVDGLSVMDGNPASEDGTGYVIDSYHPLKVKGFRYSDDHVGAFKFTSKGGGYVSEKGNELEKNRGVIGIRIFNEKIYPHIVIKNEEHIPSPKDPYWNYPYITCCDPDFNNDDSLTTPQDDMWCYRDNDTEYMKLSSGDPTYACDTSDISMLRASLKPSGFNMETGWGQKKEQKVVEVNFEKGELLLSLDIYYASRESLVEMGVPLTNETKVSFPKSFTEKYAKPPKGWAG